MQQETPEGDEGLAQPDEWIEDGVSEIIGGVQLPPVPVECIPDELIRQQQLASRGSLSKSALDSDLSSSYQVVAPKTVLLASMELAAFGKISKKEGIIPRLEDLEQKALGAQAEQQKSLHIDQRFNELVGLIKPSNTQLSQGFKASGKNNWFTNPPPIPWISRIGTGLGGKAKQVGKFVTSPEFLTLVGAAAAVVGGYYLSRSMMRDMRNLPPGYAAGYNNAAARGHACIGASDCRVCDNCSACIHCNSGGSPCGVWYRSRGY